MKNFVIDLENAQNCNVLLKLLDIALKSEGIKAIDAVQFFSKKITDLNNQKTDVLKEDEVKNKKQLNN